MLVSASATDYLWQFQRLLPRGRVWHRGWGLLQDAVLLTLMRTWARLHEDANDLIVDAFPCSTSGLLPEWEATLGLPDPCTGPLDNLQQRTSAVCLKFSSRGGQSVDYFIHLAASLGFEITITQYSPFLADVSHAGEPLYDNAWAHAWQVTAQETDVVYFRAGVSAAGEPLATWGNALLECAFNALKPAHTVIIYSYALFASSWDENESIWDTGESVWDKGVIVDG